MLAAPLRRRRTWPPNPQSTAEKSLRLPIYDYSSAGAYFITICTINRECIFDAAPIAAALTEEWLALGQRFGNVSLDEFVVMPNHVHGIIVLHREVIGAQRASAPTLGKVVRAFKSLSAIRINRLLGRDGTPPWQRNYYEHVIRTDRTLDRIRQYIQEDAARWSEDPENPANIAPPG